MSASIKAASKTAKRESLPTDAEGIVKLCEEIGWTVARSRVGAKISNGFGATATVSTTAGAMGQGRNLANVHAALRRMGIDEAIAGYRIQAENAKAKALAEDRAKAASRVPPPAFLAAAAANGNGKGGEDSGGTAPAAKAVRPVTTGRPWGGPELITPERAEELLDRPLPLLPDGTRLKQRAIVDSHVAVLARAIKEGRWRLTHQGLALAPEEPENTGGVLDGQHRLWAITHAQKPVEMMVTYNVDPTAFVILDTGKSRSAAAAFQIGGESNSFNLVSTLKLLHMWNWWRLDPNGPAGNWQQWSRRTVSHDEISLTLAGAPDIREDLRIAGGIYGPPLRASSAAATVFRHLIRTAWPESVSDDPNNPGQLDKFLSDLRFGENISGPVLTLRNWLIGRGQRRYYGIGREVTLYAFILTWNKLARGDELKLIKILDNQPMLMPIVPPRP